MLPGEGEPLDLQALDHPECRLFRVERLDSDPKRVFVVEQIPSSVVVLVQYIHVSRLVADAALND